MMRKGKVIGRGLKCKNYILEKIIAREEIRKKNVYIKS